MTTPMNLIVGYYSKSDDDMNDYNEDHDESKSDDDMNDDDENGVDRGGRVQDEAMYEKQFRRDWRTGGAVWVWYAKGGDGTGAPIRAKVRSKVKDKGASRVKRSKYLELWELCFDEVDEEGNKAVGYYDYHFWRIFSLKKDCKLYCQEGME